MVKKDELMPARRCMLPICECWPAYVQSVLTQCLANDPHLRPRVAEVRHGLAEQVEVSCSGRRRSLQLSSTTVDMSSVSNNSHGTDYGTDYRTSLGYTDSETDSIQTNSVANFG